MLDGKSLLVGSRKLLDENEIEDVSGVYGSEMGTITFVSYDEKYKGYIVVSDTIKDEAREALLNLSVRVSRRRLCSRAIGKRLQRL